MNTEITAKKPVLKLLSFQPFSVYDNCGGSRILRRIYEGKEDTITSVGVTVTPKKALQGKIKETLVGAKPLHRKWMRWHLRKIERWLRETVFFSSTKKQIQKLVLNTDYDIVHVLDHSKLSAAITELVDEKKLSSNNLWVSFHDHFTTTEGGKDTTNGLWNRASRRLVISKELGDHYQSLFGNKSYELITDGVEQSEISVPKQISKDQTIVIYFSGLLHLEYLPLFRSLGEALDELSTEGMKVKLVLRGTQHVEFLTNRKFEVEMRPSTLDTKVLKDELDAADILYLPIKFTVPDFYLYSLSTKMVGYLGASGTILYHGPQDSAACKLLSANESAITCNGLDHNDLKNAVKAAVLNNAVCSANGKKLVQKQFVMKNIQQQFWQQ